MKIFQTTSKISIFFLFLFSHWQIAPPSYAESQYRANIGDKTDSEHTQFSNGQNDFAPRYPVYTSATLPTLPNAKNWNPVLISINQFMNIEIQNNPSRFM